MQDQQRRDLLKSIFLIPFRNLQMTSKNPPMPILLSKLQVNVVECNSTINYKILLKYDNYEWEVIHNIVSIYGLKIALELNGKIHIHIPKSRLLSSERFKIIEDVLKDIISKSVYDDSYEIYKFFQISKVSFVGNKIYDCVLNVKIETGDTGSCLCCFDNSKINFEEKFVSLKQNLLVLMDYKSNKVENVFFIRKYFVLKRSRTGFREQIEIILLEKIIKIKSRHKSNIDKLYNLISEMIESSSENLYESFSKQNDKSEIDFIIDGKDYFSAVYDSIRSAKQEVFIAGWWIYPNLYLKREKLAKKYRLSNLLKKKAEEGVKIYILIFKENRLALPNDSFYAEMVLGKIHQNLKIIRHPFFKKVGFTYWSHHEKIVVVDQRVAFTGGLDLTLGRYDDCEHNLFENNKIPGSENIHAKNAKNRNMKVQKCVLEDASSEADQNLTEDSHLWPGMDFSNPLKRNFTVELEDGSVDIIDRKVIPRMPWHDIQCRVKGMAVCDISSHFIERWNSAVINGRSNFDLIIPKIKNSFTESPMKSQVLRSSSPWAGCSYNENSIEHAYISFIKDSKKYIYIENQFFISRSSFQEKHGPLNRIGEAIAQRIIRAHSERELFKIYVVMPLLPAFEANFDDNYVTTLKKMIKIQNGSIIGSENSLEAVLSKKGINIFDFVIFLSLKKYQIFDGRAYDEEIYVHSKIMIVDGEKAIVGSANINDRSMLGHRDSELSISIEESNSKGKVFDLLKNLISEHLGEEITDFESNETFNKIREIADFNTKIFRTVFRSIPDNKITTIKELKEFKKSKGVEEIFLAEKILKRVRGRFVNYPYNFLKKEILINRLISTDTLISEEIYH